MTENKPIEAAVHQNQMLEWIGTDTFKKSVASYLQPYERFLLAGTCRWMNAIFNLSSFDFQLHSKSDLGVLKQITDKYFKKQKSYRHCSNCVDLSKKTYQNLSHHEKLCIKYVLIFQEKLPEYFPVNSFQNFLDYSLKLTFSSNDPEQSDSIIQFLSDAIVHEESGVAPLITSLHLDNIGLNSFNHLDVLSNTILVYTHNLRYLYLADNPLVNDMYIQDLFLCIAANNHQLEILDLSNTSITNKTCDVIYDFCLSVYKINKGIANYTSSDNESQSDYSFIRHEKESQTPSHDDFQEIIYMSSEGTDDENDQDTEFSTDDEYDNIVARRLNEDTPVVAHNTTNEVTMEEHDEETEIEDVVETDHDEDEETETIDTSHISVTDEHDQLPSECEGMRIAFGGKIWIDLKNNKGISTEGVDKLNQIYVKRIERNLNRYVIL